MPLIKALRKLNHTLYKESGLATLSGSSRDVRILLLARLLRMLAYGASALMLALYLSASGYSDFLVGLFMTMTLIGDLLISLALTFVADNLGTRRTLLLGSILMAMSGITFATVSNYWILLAAAVFGIISPGGNEIGPFRAVEESTLAHLTPATVRSDIFAWYVVAGTLGATGGFLLGGWQIQLFQSTGWSDLAAYRSVFVTYALIGAVKIGLSLQLNPQCELEPASIPEESEAFISGQAQTSDNAKAASPKSRWGISQISQRSTLAKLCALFFTDSLGSGMVPMSLISLYIERKFDIDVGQLGTIVSAASFLSSMGNILASSVSNRVGLVQTMVFTHLPSAIFLALIPAPRSLALTVVLLVARTFLASMDQAPRSAFLSAIVISSERTAVMGTVNSVKTASQSMGPLVAGALAGSHKFWMAFLFAGSLKASYDLGLLYMFSQTQERNIEISEERDTQLHIVGNDSDENLASRRRSDEEHD